MSRGNHKPGPRNKKGDWVLTHRGRSNRARSLRTTVVCPHNHHHIVSAQGFLAHLNTHGGTQS